MNATKQLNTLGQRPWLGHITRQLLDIGSPTPADGGDCETVLANFRAAGIDLEALAAQLQRDGAASSIKSWHELMGVITAKSVSLATAG